MLMPFGKHKNKKMEDVPADYLLWAFNNAEIHGDLKKYIDANINGIKKEVEDGQ